MEMVSPFPGFLCLPYLLARLLRVDRTRHIPVYNEPRRDRRDWHEMEGQGGALDPEGPLSRSRRYSDHRDER